MSKKPQTVIVASSTCMQANAAIGIIRISGFTNIRQLQKFFSYNLEKLKVKTATRSFVLDLNKKIIDDALLLFFKEGQSFTNENLLEIHCHGNTLLMDLIIENLISLPNFRYAKAGEFSLRALKNKKLDLHQVEGLDLLLNASSPYMLSQGMELINGSLYRQYKDLYAQFLHLKSLFEVGIDFGEDIGEKQLKEKIHESLDKLQLISNNLYERAKIDSSDLFTPSIGLFGLPNSGKSSLFNSILEQERAIVSNIAGTTRDYLSEFVTFNKNRFKLIDTAGLRFSKDEIEKIGIERSLGLLKDCFFKVLVINPYLENFKSISEVLPFELDQFDLIVFTHSDQIGFKVQKQKFLSSLEDNTTMQSSQEGALEALAFIKSIESIETGPIGPVEAKINKQKLENSFGPIGPILEKCNSKYLKLLEKEPLLLGRHRAKVESIKKEVDHFAHLLLGESDMGILSFELQKIEKETSELIGIIKPVEVLDHIFDNFCIGK